MRRLFFITLIVAAVVIIAALTYAENGGLTLPWHSVAGGGGISGDGARFSVTGTIGQAEAGQARGASRFQVDGGFISGLPGHGTQWKVYLPLVERN